MQPNDLRLEYDRRFPTYVRASKNIREAIELLIESAEIPVLAVLSRVKSFESFQEKVEKKNYANPFGQSTDFVGIRAILYFPKDVISATELLTKEFDVIESADKADLLQTNEFGYRSHHLLLRTPKSWASTPNYRGLEQITVEVQLRTVLMHAWAEIEHKLQYKSKVQVPLNLQRKLFLLSAKVEEADDQFQSLVADVGAYRKDIAMKAAKAGKFDVTIELNLDTLKELLVFFYPTCYTHDVMTQELFNEITLSHITLPELVKYAEKFRAYEDDLNQKVSSLSSAAKLNYALDVFAPNFSPKSLYSRDRQKVIEELKRLANSN
jgi:putative GTP pyrophosphokinase